MGSLPNSSILKGPTRALKQEYIHRIFESVAEKSSQDIALVFEDDGETRKHSYYTLDTLTNKLARGLIKTLGAAQTANSDGDNIIAVSMAPSDKLVATLLTIWKAGAAYLPIDPSFPQARIEHIVNEAKPLMLVSDREFEHQELVKSVTFEELMEFSDDMSIASLGDEEVLKHREGRLAIVLYTSGSTGIPKGVRIPHEVILNRLQWQFNTFPYSDTERNCVFKTALTFVDSVSEIWGPLLNGRSILVVPKKTTQDPEKLVMKLEEYRIERLVLVPSLLRSILLYLDLQKEIDDPLSKLKTWVCSGEPLPVLLADEFFRRFPTGHKLCNFYGSTEVMGDVTFHVLENKDQLMEKTKVPIGLPVDNTIVYLLDQNLKPVESGATGELWVSGSNLAAGYVNGRDPERFISNPLNPLSQYSRLYRTGDYASVEKGTIVYEGRTDSQVKIRGHRVDLSEVERAVLTIPGLDKAVVLCYHPGDIDQALLSFVTLQQGTFMSERQIEKVLSDRLASYMIPQVVIIETVPLLVNGKTDRQALLKSYENTNNNDDSQVEVEIDYAGVPEKKLKEATALLETVASVLNRSARAAITIDANFYEIGGNSLNSIVTITKLNEKGYYISIGDFIGATNLREVLMKMSSDSAINDAIEPSTYIFEKLNDEHKEAVFEMITTSFYLKADLEQWLMPDIKEEDYPNLLEKMWVPMVEADLSFVAKNEEGTPIGVTLNFDAYDEPEVEVHSKLEVIFEFLEFLEGPLRETKLPQGKGNILHNFMMGTNQILNAKENIAVMHSMEDQVIKIAKEKKFAGVLTVNTSPLTQQVGKDIYGYNVLLDYQVNEYVASDGTKPFGAAPDDQRAMVCWKTV